MQGEGQLLREAGGRQSPPPACVHASAGYQLILRTISYAESPQ